MPPRIQKPVVEKRPLEADAPAVGNSGISQGQNSEQSKKNKNHTNTRTMLNAYYETLKPIFNEKKYIFHELNTILLFNHSNMEQYKVGEDRTSTARAQLKTYSSNMKCVEYLCDMSTRYIALFDFDISNAPKLEDLTSSVEESDQLFEERLSGIHNFYPYVLNYGHESMGTTNDFKVGLSQLYNEFKYLVHTDIEPVVRSSGETVPKVVPSHPRNMEYQLVSYFMQVLVKYGTVKTFNSFVPDLSIYGAYYYCNLHDIPTDSKVFMALTFYLLFVYSHTLNYEQKSLLQGPEHKIYCNFSKFIIDISDEKTDVKQNKECKEALINSDVMKMFGSRVLKDDDIHQHFVVAERFFRWMLGYELLKEKGNSDAVLEFMKDVHCAVFTNGFKDDDYPLKSSMAKTNIFSPLCKLSYSEAPLWKRYNFPFQIITSVFKYETESGRRVTLHDYAERGVVSMFEKQYGNERMTKVQREYLNVLNRTDITPEDFEKVAIGLTLYIIGYYLNFNSSTVSDVNDLYTNIYDKFDAKVGDEYKNHVYSDAVNASTNYFNFSALDETEEIGSVFIDRHDPRRRGNSFAIGHRPKFEAKSKMYKMYGLESWKPADIKHIKFSELFNNTSNVIEYILESSLSECMTGDLPLDCFKYFSGNNQFFTYSEWSLTNCLSEPAFVSSLSIGHFIFLKYCSYFKISLKKYSEKSAVLNEFKFWPILRVSPTDPSFPLFLYSNFSKLLNHTKSSRSSNGIEKLVTFVDSLQIKGGVFEGNVFKQFYDAYMYSNKSHKYYIPIVSALISAISVSTSSTIDNLSDAAVNVLEYGCFYACGLELGLSKFGSKHKLLGFLSDLKRDIRKTVKDLPFISDSHKETLKRVYGKLDKSPPKLKITSLQILISKPLKYSNERKDANDVFRKNYEMRNESPYSSSYNPASSTKMELPKYNSDNIAPGGLLFGNLDPDVFLSDNFTTKNF